MAVCLSADTLILLYRLFLHLTLKLGFKAKEPFIVKKECMKDLNGYINMVTKMMITIQQFISLQFQTLLIPNLLILTFLLPAAIFLNLNALANLNALTYPLPQQEDTNLQNL